MLFLALSSLYYFKERSRLFQEEKVKNRLIYSECQHLNKIMQGDTKCQMPLIGDIKALEDTIYDISFTLLFALLFILPSAYILAMISLRPMRDSIDTIDSFINGIVHDINTPLSVIKLNAQSMNNSLEDEKQKAKNSRILQGIEDIEALEKQLLFSLKSDRYVLKATTFDIQTLLLNRLEYYNDIRDVIAVSLHVDSFVIKADSDIFIRMIDNIVLNAIKFSPRNSEVKIALNNAILVVQDCGVGIKNPDEVFMKYYREDRSVKGLGLGLFIVKSVANLHDIELSIDSKVGVGTKFCVDLTTIKVD